MKWLDSPPKTECRLQLAMVCGPQAQAFNLGVSFWHDDYTCGPGNLEMHLQLLCDLGATCFGATARWLFCLRKRWRGQIERQVEITQDDLRSRNPQ